MFNSNNIQNAPLGASPVPAGQSGFLVKMGGYARESNLAIEP